MSLADLERRVIACSFAVLAARSPTERDARYREWEAAVRALRAALS